MLNKKIFISISILFLVFNLLIISSALELNPFAKKKIYESTLKEDMSDFLKEDFNSNYGVIRLSKTFFWIETDKVAEYSLIENTEQCLIDCEARGKATLYKSGQLFDDLRFIGKKGTEKDLNAQYLIKEIETYEVEVPNEKKEVCVDVIGNLTKESETSKNCYDEIVSYKMESREREVWNEYKGQTLAPGNYEWKIVANKKPLESVDFIPIARGKILNEWAWWNGDWEFKREITNISGKITQINVSYNPNMNQDFSDLRFLNSSEDEELNFFIREKVNENYAIIDIAINEQESIYLYYGNEMATSTATNLTYFEPIAYYTLDESTGTNAKDIISSSNGTLNSAGWGIGKLNNGLVLTNPSGMYTPNNVLDFGTDKFTFAFWVNATTGSPNPYYPFAYNQWGESNHISIRCNSGNWQYIRGDGSFNFGSCGTDSQWHLITCVRSSTGTNGVHCQVDGGTLGYLTDSVNHIGSSYKLGYDPLTGGMNGRVDEFILWKKDLSQEEIQSIYQFTKSNAIFGDEELNDGVSVSLSSPANAFNSTSSTIFFNATITPINAEIKNVTLYLNDEEYLNLYDTNETINYSKLLTLSDGEYSWNITACGLNINDETICSTSETRSMTIDTTAPTITANLNETILYSEGQEVGLEYNITDSNLGSCWYTYNDINTSINCSETSATITTTLSALDVVVYANDSFGNLNQSETLSMTIDDTAPQLEIINPTNNTTYNDFILLNITSTDDNLDSIWYNLNDGENITYIKPIKIAGLHGINYLNVYANDTLDNTNSSSIIYYLEKLNISLTSPLNDTITYYNPVTFIANATSLEGYLYNATLYYNDGSGWESESIYSGIITNITSLDITSLDYTSKNFSVSSQEGNPIGLHFSINGDKMYIVGDGARVFQYTLSTPWDVSTASYNNKNFSVSSQDGTPYGLFIDRSGTRMYINGQANHRVFQYTLSTPWDVSTASYNNKYFSVSTQIGASVPLGLYFSDLGDKMYVGGYTNEEIYQYNLSTPWDVSTASYETEIAVATVPYGLTFSSDGYSFLYPERTNDRIYQYNLSTPWDVSTATIYDYNDISSQEGNPSGVYINFIGGFYMVGTDNDRVYQYDIGGSSLSVVYFNKSFNPGEIIEWNVEVCINDGSCEFAENNWTFTIDDTAPIIALSAGNETEDYYYSGINHTINFTITDDNLDSIWWEYNGLNTSISPAISGEAQSISFEVEEGVYTATIYTNDIIGNLNQLVVNWNYGLIEDSITFNPTTIEGSIENYYLNLTLSGLSLISATFHYDGISQISQIEVDGNERFVKIEDFEVPAVTTEEDKEFYWTLVFSDGTILNSTFNNQSVTNIGISGCGGSYTYRLIDLYLKDEETTDTINGYIEVDYSIFNPTTETIVQNYSYLFEDVNTASICSDLDLSDSDFLFDAQIRYYATNYSSELYNIQMGSLETLTNLSLYYLAIDDSTEFLVTYQDENAIRVEGAIIQLLRKYVSEGIYRVVEAPETSADGTAVLHIDLNSVIYDVIVVKDGVELDRFENVVFACDSAYSTLCTQNLYGTLDPGNSIPIETIDDFSYTLTTFNDSIKLTYSITSGVPSDINMILEQIDSFGSKINCNESVTSSGGSIECGFNETIGDSIVKVLVLRDEEPVAIKSYVLEEDRSIEFLGNNYFIALIILLSVVAMAFSSPEWIVMNGVFTMLILGGLTLVRGLDFTIGLGSLMWLIIAGAILVMKISKQEDR